MNKKSFNRPQDNGQQPQSKSVGLELGFVPGTSGAGRIAATGKAGLYSSHDKFRLGDSATQSMVAVAYWIPSPGPIGSAAGRKVINAAYYKYYNKQRAANMSVSQYTPIDVFKEYYGIANLNILVAKIRRKLRVLCSKGSQVNSAFPEALIAAEGLNAVTDGTALASYITRFNRVIATASQFALPRDFKIAARYLALEGSVFKDDPVLEKSQYIIFDATHYYSYIKNATDPDVGRLKPISLMGKTLSDLLDLLEAEVEVYSTDSDTQNIFAEVRKAYGDADRFIHQPFVWEEINPVFHQVVLDGLKNASLVGFINAADTEWWISDNGAELYYSTSSTPPGSLTQFAKPVRAFDGRGGAEKDDDITCVINYGTTSYQFNTDLSSMMGAGGIMSDRYMMCHDDQPDEQNMAVLSMFAATFGLNFPGGTTANSCIYVHMFGTELIEGVGIVHASGNSTYANTIFGWVNINVYPTSDTSIAFWSDISKYVSFSNLPKIYLGVVSSKAGTNSIKLLPLYGDIDNKFLVTDQALDQLHLASVAWLIQPEE